MSVLAACQAPVAPIRVGSIVFPGYELMFLARELGLLNERQVRLVELLSNTDTVRGVPGAYDEFVEVCEDVVRETSTGEAPWHVIEGSNAEYRSLAAGRLLARVPVYA